MKSKYLVIIITLLCADILAGFFVYDLAGQKFLEVSFFDVGQGDAAFVGTPGGHQILIDGGPNSSVLEKLGKVMPFWDRSIDLVILSHPEKDHISGLIEVLKRYKVENILWTGVVRGTAEYQEWMQGLKKEGAKIIIAQAGQVISGGQTSQGRFDLYVLSPSESLEGKVLKDSNDSSIVVKLVFGKESFLFTGDISGKLETSLAKSLSEIDSDVLKISHHGSKYSSADEFIKAVSPQIAVIEVGKNNSYGHPTQEVLNRLLKYGIDILRTDQYGDIKFVSDGIGLKLKN